MSASAASNGGAATWSEQTDSGSRAHCRQGDDPVQGGLEDETIARPQAASGCGSAATKRRRFRPIPPPKMRESVALGSGAHGPEVIRRGKVGKGTLPRCFGSRLTGRSLGKPRLDSSV